MKKQYIAPDMQVVIMATRQTLLNMSDPNGYYDEYSDQVEL